MDAHELYGLPLERFVPERSALAKALRAEGRRTEAAEVAKLPKPSRAAWAVNQLVRTQRRAVTALFEAGDALQRAQAEVIGGRGDARALREAAERERAAVKRLSDAARGLLTDEGHGLTPATLDRVSETLHAAALDDDARKQVEHACLERELRHIGLGGLGGLEAPPTPRAPSPRGGDSGGGRGSTKTAGHPKREDEQATAQRAAAEQAARERAKRERAERLKSARKAEAEARRAAERAERDLQAAQAHRDRAADALAEAEEAVGDARARAKQAADAQRLAEQALERLRD